MKHFFYIDLNLHFSYNIIYQDSDIIEHSTYFGIIRNTINDCAL